MDKTEQQLELRDVFNKQPFHYLIIDATPPMCDATIEKICEILNNVLALSHAMKGSVRIRGVGLSLVGRIQKCVIPLQLFNINYQSIKRDLAKVEQHFEDVYLECCADKTVFYHALNEAFTRFKSITSGSGDVDSIKLEISVLSAQPAKKLIPTLQGIAKELRLTYNVKIDVIRVTNMSLVPPLKVNGLDSSQSSVSSTSRESEELGLGDCGGFNQLFTAIDFASMDLNVYQLEGLFKNWLHDANIDQEHLRLYLKFDSNDDAIEIKCDIRESLISPHVLTNGGKFLARTDFGSTQFTSPPNSKNVSRKVPILKMDLIKPFQISGICESVLFDAPLTLYATQSLKLDFDESENNQRAFLALNNLLIQKGLAILLKKRNALTETDENVYFLALPSGEQCMLLKAIVNKELYLPRIIENVLLSSRADSPSSSQSDWSKKMEEIITKFDVGDVFNPLSFPSGLYSQLLPLAGASAKPKNRASTSTGPYPERKRTTNAKNAERSQNSSRLSISIAHFEFNERSYGGNRETQFQTAANVLASRRNHTKK